MTIRITRKGETKTYLTATNDGDDDEDEDEDDEMIMVLRTKDEQIRWLCTE